MDPRRYFPSRKAKKRPKREKCHENGSRNGDKSAATTKPSSPRGGERAPQTFLQTPPILRCPPKCTQEGGFGVDPNFELPPGFVFRARGAKAGPREANKQKKKGWGGREGGRSGEQSSDTRTTSQVCWPQDAGRSKPQKHRGLWGDEESWAPGRASLGFLLSGREQKGDVEGSKTYQRTAPEPLEMGKGRGEVSGKLLALKSCSLSPKTGMPASKGRKIKKRKKKKGRGRGMERGSSSARALVPLQLGALLALALSVIFGGKKGTKLKKNNNKKNPSSWNRRPSSRPRFALCV